MRPILAAVLLASPAVSMAQPAEPLRGTRLEIVATGEATRIPDMARIGAGVVSAAPTASAAMEANARQMASVRAALKRAGIADRDIQTSSLSLFPEYREGTPDAAPRIVGYRASNEVSVTFRDIASTGKILDALVSQGANQINGPRLSIDHPEAALDEARVKALAAARARADLYARAAGKHVGRLIAISEAGSAGPIRSAGLVNSLPKLSTALDPGTQTLSVTLNVTFELD
jgi:uncharacterized protein YggE